MRAKHREMLLNLIEEMVYDVLLYEELENGISQCDTDGEAWPDCQMMLDALKRAWEPLAPWIQNAHNHEPSESNLARMHTHIYEVIIADRTR